MPASDSVSSEPSPPASDRTVFQPNPAIVGPRPLAVDSWSAVDGDRVALHFTTGSPACYGIDAKVVDETDSTVTVYLRTGALPDAVGKMCTMIAVFGTVELPLQAPLGDRAVVSVP